MPLSVIPLPGMPPTTVVSVVNTGQPGKASVEQSGETSAEPSQPSGSDTITITGENLMKVFTRMLEILDEKKTEKNNS